MTFRLRSFFSGRLARNALASCTELLHNAENLIKAGSLDQAAQVLRQLLALEPNHAEAWYKLGNVSKDLGHLQEASASYERAIELMPRYAAAHCNRGVVLLALGRTDEAASAFRSAVGIDVQDAIAYYNLGVSQQLLKRVDEAQDSYNKAIELNSNYTHAIFGRGRLHEEMARWQDALRDYDHLLDIHSEISRLHFHRGDVLVQLKRWEEALTSYNLAVLRDPGHVNAHLHRGNVLRQLKQWDSAAESYNVAIAIKPDHVDGYFNRGVLFEQLKRFPEALLSFENAITVQPDFAPAHYNRALILLATGNLLSGFANYEWRWKNRNVSFNPASYRGPAPLWDGRESLDKKSILIFSEQGLGDTLQFCRYIKLLAQLGAHVLFEVQGPLVELLSHVDGASAVISRETHIDGFDYKCALLSLPFAFGTTLETIPSDPKYLHVDQERIAQWRGRLTASTRPRIGLVWSGNVQYPNDQQRSMPLATLIKYLPRELDYFCLQTDVRVEDRATLDANSFIVDNALDFVETAALCECLDLVISVCTSIAHLAGALGTPLWILLAYNADWRWLEDREDSPWYPSARLFRQSVAGDWNDVAARVGDELLRYFGLRVVES